MRRTCSGTENSDVSLCLNCSSISTCPNAPAGMQYYVDMRECNNADENSRQLLTIDKVCKPCSQCGKGFWQRGPCTEFADTDCVRCTTCNASKDEGSFQVKACSDYNDTVCQNCTRCKPIARRSVLFIVFHVTSIKVSITHTRTQIRHGNCVPYQNANHAHAHIQTTKKQARQLLPLPQEHTRRRVHGTAVRLRPGLHLQALQDRVPHLVPLLCTGVYQGAKSHLLL